MRRVRSITVTAALVVVAVPAFLAGCASTEVVFGKAGVTQADKERDQGACLRQAIGTNERDAILLPYCVDREAFTKCMEARGYAAQPK